MKKLPSAFYIYQNYLHMCTSYRRNKMIDLIIF